MKNLSLLLVVAVVLAGCGDNTPVQTVDWYKAHEAERTAMIAKCRTNPGELDASPNCINATTAANHLVLEKRDFTRRAPINALEWGK